MALHLLFWTKQMRQRGDNVHWGSWEKSQACTWWENDVDTGQLSHQNKIIKMGKKKLFMSFSISQKHFPLPNIVQTPENFIFCWNYNKFKHTKCDILKYGDVCLRETLNSSSLCNDGVIKRRHLGVQYFLQCKLRFQKASRRAEYFMYCM